MAQTFIGETAYRVPDHTSEKINSRIRKATVRKIEEIGQNQNQTDARLRELDREWDIERAIEANASTLLLVGLALGATVDRRWFLLPGMVATFLFQHALQGWCPPVPVLRQLGFRTQREIDNERMILLARKGVLQNFKDLSPSQALSAID